MKVILPLLTALLVVTCSPVTFVDRVTIVNDTDYPANVEVTGPQRDRWLLLTTADEHSESPVEEVIDQGGVWIFRFGYAGFHEELEVPRERLARSQWRVEVPQSLQGGLQERGIPPPP